MRSIVVWVLTAGTTVQRYAPGYYGWWTDDVNGDDTLAKQFLDGVPALARIRREL